MNPALWRAALRAGALTGVVDGLFSSVLAAGFYGSTVARLFQGVASTVAGPRAVGGGPAVTALGIAMHFGVAFGWAALFGVLCAGVPALRRLLASRGGVAAAAAAYGPLVWLVMSLAVVPALLRRPPAITGRWWIQFAGHALFVGLPIAATYAAALARDARGPARPRAFA